MFGEKKSFFGRMSQRISDALLGRTSIDEDFLEELEEILITSFSANVSAAFFTSFISSSKISEEISGKVFKTSTPFLSME